MQEQNFLNERRRKWSQVSDDSQFELEQLLNPDNNILSTDLELPPSLQVTGKELPKGGVTGQSILAKAPSSQQCLQSPIGIPQQEPTTRKHPRTAYNVGASSTDTDHPLECLYSTDMNGNIIWVEDDVWNRFILDNTDLMLSPSAPGLLFPAVIGRNLFEYISDKKVQSFYRHVMLMLQTGVQQRINYHWFCDSPSLERKLSMTVCRLKGQDGQAQILWISRIISETPQETPASYLDYISSAIASAEAKSSLPTRTVCSFCKRVLISTSELMSPTSKAAPSIQLTYQEILKSVNLIQDPTSVLPTVEPSNRMAVIGHRGKQGDQVILGGSVSSDSGIVSPSPIESLSHTPVPPFTPWTSSIGSGSQSTPSVGSLHLLTPSSPSSGIGSSSQIGTAQVPPAPPHLWVTPEQFYSQVVPILKANQQNSHVDSGYESGKSATQKPTSRTSIQAAAKTTKASPADAFLVNHGICELCYCELANLFIFPLLENVNNGGAPPKSVKS